MQFEDGPQLPLTTRRKVLVAIGVVMALAQLVAAVLVAPATTGPGDADPALLGAMWCACVAWSMVAVLLLVRQADLPDVATASFLVVISTQALFALSGAMDLRGTPDEVDLVDTMFLGITAGAMTALIVWALAMGAARVLRLPTTAELREER